MKFLDTGDLIEAPRFDIPRLHCAKYAVMAAKELSEANYIHGDAWDLGKKNKIVRDNFKSLIENVDLLIPNETIVVFYNPFSLYNQRRRVGTHAALYLGRNGDLYFAEQFNEKQRATSLRSIRRRFFKPKQILAPKG